MIIQWLLTFLEHLQFKMREPQMCAIVCNQKLDAKMVKEFKEKINDEYRVNMYLPSSQHFTDIWEICY